MEASKEKLWEEFSLAYFAFENAYAEYDNRQEAFEDDDVKRLYELALSAYLAWKNSPD